MHDYVIYFFFTKFNLHEGTHREELGPFHLDLDFRPLSLKSMSIYQPYFDNKKDEKKMIPPLVQDEVNKNNSQHQHLNCDIPKACGGGGGGGGGDPLFCILT